MCVALREVNLVHPLRRPAVRATETSCDCIVHRTREHYSAAARCPLLYQIAIKTAVGAAGLCTTEAGDLCFVPE